MRAPTILPFLAILGALAGCASAPVGPASVSSTAPTTSEPAIDEDETGSVDGLVLDDEQLPVAGASVTTGPRLASATTDARGGFVLEGLPPGPVAITVFKPGYDSQTKTAQVVVGEKTVLRFTLLPAASDEPYHDTFPHTAYHHYGGVFLESFVEDDVCEGCRWNFTTTRVPDALLVEVRGKHAITDSVHGDREFAVLESGKTDKKLLFGAQALLPLRIHVPAADLVKVPPTTEYWFRVQCDSEWVCYEETRSIWATAFHRQAMPDGFTAFQ